jgi:phospholipid/cholesterol/gamma-HCH transport system permease protein
VRNFEPVFLPEPRNLFEKAGRLVRGYTMAVGDALLITAEAFRFGHRLPRRRAELMRQMFACSVKTLFICSVVALCMGMILARQAGVILQDYNQEHRVGSLVIVSLVRELGPVMTALILAASIGSAYAAEVGTMNISEEVSALKVMSINPVDYLITPRLYALLIMCPALTMFADLIGTFGGMLVAKTQLGVSPRTFYENAVLDLKLRDVYIGLLKSVVFAIIIITVAAYQGFTTSDGAVGVGRATRRSVVISFLFIMVIGFFVTSLFY